MTSSLPSATDLARWTLAAQHPLTRQWCRDDNRLGRATADTSSSLGLPCYEVQEIILAPEFRGTGYGPHLTTLLAQELPDRDRVLMGTIHADNRSALEAAQRAGRHDVGGWLQVPLMLA